MSFRYSKETFTFLWTHLTFVHGFLISEIFSYNGPLWTMAVDVQFYLCLPILALLLQKTLREKSEEGRANVLLTSFAGLVVFSLAWRALAMIAFPIHFEDVHMSKVMSFVTLRNFFGVSGCFGMGMFIAFLNIRKFPPSPRLVNNAFIVSISLFAVNAIVLQFNSALMDLTYDLIGASSAALFLFSTNHGACKQWQAFVISPIAATLAAFSYSLYLIHYKVLGVVGNHIMPALHLKHMHGLTAIIIAGLTLVISGILAFALHEYVEKPFLAVKSRVG